MYLFANYAWDSEILQYHCFRRQYDPVLARFTSRDPVNGSHGEAMTLHKYLYCVNNPINMTDPTGQLSISQLGNFVTNTIYGINSYYTRLDASLKGASDWGSVLNAAIGVNQWRQGWFDRENLINNSNIRDMLQARVEGFALRTLDALIEAQYQMLSGCDWWPLFKCLGKDLGITGIKEGIGVISCGICSLTVPIPDPLPGFDEAISCGICAVYVKLSGNPIHQGLSAIKNVKTLSRCLQSHCGNNH